MPLPPPARPRGGPAASRRSVLLATAGTVTLLASGCDLLDGERPGPPVGTGADAGRDLLGTVRADTADLVALLAATTATHPALAPTLEGLRRTLTEHLAVLDRSLGAGTAGATSPGASTPSASSGPGVPPRPAPALARVRRTHAAHMSQVLDGARTSTDGSLARLLACLGAGLAQQGPGLLEGPG